MRTAGSSTKSKVATNEHQWWHHLSKGLESGKIRTEWRLRQLKKEALGICLHLTLWATQKDHHGNTNHAVADSCCKYTQPIKMAAKRGGIIQRTRDLGLTATSPFGFLKGAKWFSSEFMKLQTFNRLLQGLTIRQSVSGNEFYLPFQHKYSQF